MSRATIPRPASTTLVVRDVGHALQVLMLRRSLAASFMPGSYVFPGGAVDASDASPDMLSRCPESEPEAAQRLGIADNALAHAVAALRECFEECGLWLGAAAPIAASTLALARQRLCAGTTDLAAISAELGLSLATRALAPWSHWITPIDAPKRFDTQFFVALAPPNQEPAVDARETVNAVWVGPREALARHAAGELPLEFATLRTLDSLLPFEDAAALMRHARTPRARQAIQPRVAQTHAGERRVLLPGDHAYAEVMRLDAEGTGTACCTLPAGVPVRLAPTVWRLTAPNPGVMTGPGTNSYGVGTRDGCVVIDPGPADESHIDALLQACHGRLLAVLVTHTHPDHSPAAARLTARTGAPCIGLPPPSHGRQDASFTPQRVPGDGERFDWPGLSLTAIHTPGHASNHVCWWLEEERMLFTGDHLMQGSTVVVDPPDGDMAAYLASLRALPERLPHLEWLAPGHGFLMDRPHEAIERLLRHRAAREAKVVAALGGMRPMSLDALVRSVYDDVPAHLHPAARRSLLAHLIKLRAEGRAQERGSCWHSLADDEGMLRVIPRISTLPSPGEIH